MNRLKEFREEAWLTVRELSERSGVSEDTITKIENGHRKGRGTTLRKLAKALGVSFEELSSEHFERTTDAEIKAPEIRSPRAYGDASVLGLSSFELSKEDSPVSKVLQDTHTLGEAISRVYEVMRAIDQPVDTSPPQMGLPDDVPRMNISERQQKVLITVLECGEVGPSTVADRLEISVSTAYRDLSVLEEHGLVQADESGKRLVSPLGRDLVEAIVNKKSKLSLDKALSHFTTLMKVYDSVAEFDPYRATDEDAASFFRLQELMIQAIQRIAALTEPARLANQVQQNLGAGDAEQKDAVDYYAQRAPVNQDEPEGDTIIDLQADDGSQIDGLEDRLLLQEAIEGLKGQQQQILRLRFNEGKTQTEIADHIGVSQMHVSRLLRRAIEDLRVELEHLEHDRATGQPMSRDRPR
jgi:RNA polymerase sigma factor (sigma-70 family)